MGKLTGIMVTLAILSISSLLIGVTIASNITGETTGITTEEDFEKMVSETVDEISTYIQIRDQKGKYYNINGEQRIEKIAIMISPLVSQEIDVSKLTIQLCDGDIVRILTYDGNAEHLDSNSVFEHPIWNNLNGNNYGFISISDSDGSLVDNNALNDYSDNAYIVIRLPSDMTMEKYDKIAVTLFPATGITRTTILEAPLPMKQIITFE